MNVVYKEIYTYKKGETKFDYLWDVPIYKRCTRGAGYYKFSIKEITYLPVSFDDTNQNFKERIVVHCQGHHLKEGRQSFKLKLKYNNQSKKFEIYSTVEYLYFSPLEYFLYMENKKALHVRFTKNSKQYKYELQEIKMKYPEDFL